MGQVSSARDSIADWSHGANTAASADLRNRWGSAAPVLAHILDEGGSNDAVRSGMGSPLPHPGLKRITFAVRVDVNVFWQAWTRLNEERGWRL